MVADELAPQQLRDGVWRFCPSADLPEGRVRSAYLGELPVAVAHHRGRLAAFGAICPHQGVDLAAGILEDEGTLACPEHLWSFDLCSGVCTMIEGVSIPIYEVREEGGWIVVNTL